MTHCAGQNLLAYPQATLLIEAQNSGARRISFCLSVVTQIALPVSIVISAMCMKPAAIVKGTGSDDDSNQGMQIRLNSQTRTYPMHMLYELGLWQFC